MVNGPEDTDASGRTPQGRADRESSTESDKNKNKRGIFILVGTRKRKTQIGSSLSGPFGLKEYRPRRKVREFSRSWLNSAYITSSIGGNKTPSETNRRDGY